MVDWKIVIATLASNVEDHFDMLRFRLEQRLGWETPINTGNAIQYKTSSTQGSVRLKLGEEVNIIRAGTRTARISIKKLETAPVK